MWRILLRENAKYFDKSKTSVALIHAIVEGIFTAKTQARCAKSMLFFCQSKASGKGSGLGPRMKVITNSLGTDAPC